MESPASPRWVRVCLGLVLMVYVLYSSFGVAAPFLWGHHGYHGATYAQRARMTLRFHLVTPATAAGYDEPPTKEFYYLHHPIGYHHLLVPFMKVLGEREWVLRGTAALGGVPLILMLYTLVRRRWSAPAGVLAAAVYVSLPILCSFSVLVDPMLPAMTLSILTVYAYLNYLEQPTRRWLIMACLAYVAAGLLMYEAYFQALLHGLHALYWGLRGRRDRARVAAALRWFFVTGVVSTATLAFHLLYTWKVGMWSDFMSSFQMRHSSSFEYAFSQDKKWLLLLYGWPPIAAGLLWLGLYVVRAVRGRARLRDQAVLIFFVINTLYLILFAQGAAVHLYRVFWYSSFLALAVMDLVVEAHGALVRAGAGAGRAALAAGGLVVGYFAADVPHAIDNLRESREVMGTHGHPGYSPDYQKLRFAMEVVAKLDRDDYYFTYSNLSKRVEFNYYLDRRDAIVYSLAELPTRLKQHPRAVLVLEYHLSPSEQDLLEALARKHPVYLYDSYMMVDLRSERPGLHQYRFVAQTPSWQWRWFVSHKYPPLVAREVLEAPAQCLYATGRVPVPAGLPQPVPPAWDNSDQVRCYHNYLAYTGGDAAGVRAELRRRSQPLDAALWPELKAVAWRPLGPLVGEVWLQLGTPAPAPQTRFRYRLHPVGTTGAPGADRTGELRLGLMPWERWPGFLYNQLVRFDSAQRSGAPSIDSPQPGTYELFFESAAGEGAAAPWQGPRLGTVTIPKK